MSCKICKVNQVSAKYFCTQCAQTLKERIQNCQRINGFDFKQFKDIMNESDLWSIINDPPKPPQRGGMILDTNALMPSVILDLLNQELGDSGVNEKCEKCEIHNESKINHLDEGELCHSCIKQVKQQILDFIEKGEKGSFDFNELKNITDNSGMSEIMDLVEYSVGSETCQSASQMIIEALDDYLVNE